MTLWEDLGLKKHYITTAKCFNCQVVQEIKVPKGETIEEFFKSARGKCSNCGTACLEPYKKPGKERDDDKQEKRWQW